MIQSLAALLHLSPDVVSLILAIAPLAAAILHSRGNKMPVLAAILDFLGAKSVPAAATPAKPAPDLPAPAGPALKALGDGLIHDKLDRLLHLLDPLAHADTPILPGPRPAS